MPEPEAARATGAPTAVELVARVQQLVDTRPVAPPCPLEWAVAAYFMGDASALAIAALRSGG